MQPYDKFKNTKMRYPRRKWKIRHPKEEKKKEQYTICNKNNQANKLNCANPIKGEPRNKLRILEYKLKKTKQIIMKIINALPWDENEKYLKMLFELKKQVGKKYELETLIMKKGTKRIGENTESKQTEINRFLKDDLYIIDIHIERRKKAIEVAAQFTECERKWESEDKEYELYVERKISDLDKDIEIERKKVEKKKKPLKESIEYYKKLVYQKELKYVETKKQMETLRLKCKEMGRNTIETRTDIKGVVKAMTLGFWEIEKFNELESRRIGVKNCKYLMREQEEKLHFWDTYELDRSFTLGKLISNKNYIREQYFMKNNIQSRDRNVARKWWKRKIEIAKREPGLAYDIWKVFDDINKEIGKK